MSRHVRFREDGDQLGKSISSEELVNFADLDYREVPFGYIEGSNACKLVDDAPVLMNAQEYSDWIDKYYTKHDPTAKQLVINDYDHRSDVGEEMYKDFQAEIVLMYKGGTTLEVIIPLEAKFKPILDGLKTGDFITALVGLQQLVPANQAETDYKAYTLGEVNRVITENNWL